MDILITGGNGLLGRHLVEALQERGDSVRVLVLPDEDASWLAQRGVEVHRGDVRRLETLTAPMSGVDAVMHLAGMMGVWRPIGDYQAVNVTPGVTPGLGLDSPETATTVRVQNGKALTTDGPFVEIKEAIGGYLLFEADDLDAAIELASRIPAARLGGAIEVRPIVEW